jgi:flagellar hook-associated protein 3 FlgL
MRVTSAQIRSSLLRRVNIAQSRMLKLEEQVGSGRRIVDPSDDPTASAIARRLDAALSEIDSFEPASRQVRSRLETADATLGSVFDQLIRIQELTLSMSNDTANDTDRVAAADEAEQIRMALVGLGNTKVENEYLFSGMSTDVAPFLDDGTFVGDANTPTVEISPGVRVDGFPNGAEIFTVAGGLDVMDVVESVRDALNVNDVDALRSILDNIERAQDQVRMGRARLGPIVSRVDAADTIRQNLSLQLTDKRGQTVDAQLPEAISQMTLTSQALQASISVTAKALSQSLLNKIG